MALQILSTKLHAPGTSPATIARPRLKALLDQGILGKLVLVSAPAGFGKSSLLAAWTQDQSTEEIAWFHLDPADNDLTRFLSYLIGALQSHHEQLGNLLSALDSTPPPPIEALLTALINELARSERPVVLLLDDYHLIESPQIHEAVSFLLDHHPETLRLGHTSVYQLMAVSPGEGVPLPIVAGFALTYVLAGIYLVTALLTKMRHTLYDLASGTQVVRVSSILGPSPGPASRPEEGTYGFD
jgi:hypothetical protein